MAASCKEDKFLDMSIAEITYSNHAEDINKDLWNFNFDPNSAVTMRRKEQ
jgi:hypothetical protein